MAKLDKIKVTDGIYWVAVPEADLRIQCGCPADSVKHLMKRGLIAEVEQNGVRFETGPNAILLSDVLLQNGGFSNLAEFPVLQMLYRQGMIVPDHPGNTGTKPLLIGSDRQVKAQLEYIYRGNYGLDSETELRAAGVRPKEAHEMMRLKRKFAFGRILPTAELLDAVSVGIEPAAIRNGVTVRRVRVNVFEFRYGGDTVTVDLSLGRDQRYEVPYPLSYHHIRREYFAVIHLGDADGWDVRRPTMGSVVVFQGRLYLVDAGPNLLHRLRFLGIGISEIAGIFHTHAHDDHFCGLATLMRADHRLQYFAAPAVRASVTRKLAALLSMDAADFASFFDVHDLIVGRWNDIEGLEVRPAYSPHPVETTIMTFRVNSGRGYRTYGHFADTVSLNILKDMITEDASAAGVSRATYRRICAEYRRRLDLKKVDVGGGLIHGRAEDFRNDPSRKIILAHTSRELDDQEKEIGAGAPFGAVDVLIPAHQDYARRDAMHYLAGYFPGVPRHELDMLANNPVVSGNPETLLLRSGEKLTHLHVLLVGNVERIQVGAHFKTVLEAGALIGANDALDGAVVAHTYRATSFVQTLRIPRRAYVDFVRRNGLFETLVDLGRSRAFLQGTWVFGGNISSPVHNRLAQAMTRHDVRKGRAVGLDERPGLFLVADGRLALMLGGDRIEELAPGTCFGECSALTGSPGLFRVRALTDAAVYFLPSAALRDVPGTRWRLLEIHEKRLRRILDPECVSGAIFRWRRAFRTGVEEMDAHHRKLFAIAEALYSSTGSRTEKATLTATLEALIGYAETHFRAEEKWMKEHAFSGYARHREQHERLLRDVRALEQKFRAGEARLETELLPFLKDWVVQHILTEDRRYIVCLQPQRPAAARPSPAPRS